MLDEIPAIASVAIFDVFRVFRLLPKHFSNSSPFQNTILVDDCGEKKLFV
jgi:hypothetical protein